MTDAHRLSEVRSTGGSFTAYCLCGYHESHNDRGKATATLYLHVINSGRPECPTPNKTQYPNRIHAENAIRHFWGKPGAGHRPVRAYECPSGKHWHTSKQPVHERRAA